MFACLGVTLGGCILVPGDGDDVGIGDDETGWDDDGATSGTTGGTTDEPLETDTEGPDGTGGSEGDTDADTDGDDVGDGLLCDANILLDPGFEEGTPNPSWTERSDLFGTPLCDETCSTEEGAAPYEGQWWAWFGGFEEPDTAALSQEVTLDSDRALLSFMLQMNASAGEGADTLTVFVDDQEVHMISDAEVDDYAEWTEVVVDISEFADGQPHEITLEAVLTGNGVSNFFVDDVWVQSCTEEGASGEDTGTTGSDTDTDGDETEETTDTDGEDPSDTDGTTTG